MVACSAVSHYGSHAANCQRVSVLIMTDTLEFEFTNQPPKEKRFDRLSEAKERQTYPWLKRAPPSLCELRRAGRWIFPNNCPLRFAFCPAQRLWAQPRLAFELPP